MVSADAFARLAMNPVQVPVGIVTGLLGGIFFLYLMRRRREIGKP
jgi:iron complex transport system permease protein